MSPSNPSYSRIKKNTKHFFTGTLFSRVTGYFRDLALADTFGANPWIAIFLVAFRFSNLPRRLFGEGALQSILIAHYEELKKGRKEPESFEKVIQFFKDQKTTWSAGLTFFIISLMGICSLIKWSAPLGEHDLQILHYVIIMMPGIWFICMSAINDAFLKSHNQFLLSSIAPIFFNLSWITVAILLKGVETKQAVEIMAYSVCISYFCQWLATSLSAKYEIYKRGPALSSKGVLLSSEVKQVIKPLLLGIVGVGATQINALLDSLFALRADPSGPAYLWYGIRIEQAPLSLIGMAISSAPMPALARAVKEEKWQEAHSIFSFTHKRMIKIMLATGSALICLGYDGIRILLERGQFSPETSYQTARCLWAYGFGLVAQCTIFIYQNACFSLNLYKFTTRCSIYAVICNITLNTLFIYILDFKSASIALATSLSTLLQLYLLKRGLEKRLPSFSLNLRKMDIFKPLLLFFGCFLIFFYIFCLTENLSFSAFLMGNVWPDTKKSLLDKAFTLGTRGTLWATLFTAGAYILRVPHPLFGFRDKKN